MAGGHLLPGQFLQPERQQDYATALRVIDRAIQQQDSPAYQTLKLRIRKNLRTSQHTQAQASRILADFGDPADLDDWELGWYIAAADLAGNKDAKDAAANERRRQRGHGVGIPDRCGKPPVLRETGE